MKTIKGTVFGAIPSKKNSKRLINIRGRIIPISSKAFMMWHTDASQTLKIDLQGLQTPFHATNHIHMFFFAKDRRLFDISNKVESVMDLLVDCGVLIDDNYSIVPSFTAHFAEVDKENPRCEFEIEL